MGLDVGCGFERYIKREVFRGKRRISTTSQSSSHSQLSLLTILLHPIQDPLIVPPKMRFTAAILLATIAVASPTSLEARHELTRRQASESCPIGYCTENGGTTGGAAGDTVTVSDLASLTEAAESEEPLTIIVSGSISGSAKIRVGSDKTIYGESGSCMSTHPTLLLSAMCCTGICY
jgi:hypothetical protein